ncbi:hypothetical protein OC842_000889 [Tilletia horrida]|uniref:Fe2OG dioxygenase domain-containing protein n=1 Tax=Tilletia horrida TaxID=155126 RepID=A0AAN6GIK5_9BASI|nr:hypothetical protein OC842_000889 [Tilletia horrida]
MLAEDDAAVNDAMLDDAEVMSGGACTPPPGTWSASPTDSLFDSPRQLLKQLYHAGVPHEDGANSAAHSSSSHRDSTITVATRSCPPISGLHLLPDIISPEQSSSTLQALLSRYHLCAEEGSSSGTASTGRNFNNQVMLFGRARALPAPQSDERKMHTFGDGPPAKRRKMDADGTSVSSTPTTSTGLPAWTDDLLSYLSVHLHPHLDPALYALLFPTPPPSNPCDPPTNAQGCTSRQVIINMYAPGQGISPHVDLLDRFGDGILICSFLSGTVMDFERAGAGAGGSGSGTMDVGEKHAVYLPAGSVAVLQGPARYEWTHGIEGRLVDRVRTGMEADPSAEAVEFLARGQRISVTIRWLLPGADVVGE